MALSERSARRRSAAPPAKPVRYGLFARLADRLSGRADGRRGIPPVPADGGDGTVRAAYTMRLEQLRSARDDAVHREQQRFLGSTAALRDRLAGAGAALVAGRAALADAEERRAVLGPGPAEEELVMRAVDGRTTPEQITRYRRSRDRADRIERLEREMAALRGQIRGHQEEIDRIDAQLADREAASRAQAMRRVEYARRRTATYWYWLTRRHPDGSAVLATLRPDTDRLPEWLEPEGRP